MNVFKNKLVWTLISIAAFLVVIFTLMPKPIDSDLNLIGDGRNVVVFVYDPNLVVSNQQTTEMNKARELIGDKANFLIAKTGDPVGEDFKKRYQARSTNLLFFDGSGKLFDRQNALLSSEELTRKLSDNRTN